MLARDLFREGRVDESLQRLQVEVRSNPSDAGRRLFLSQLLALRGEWQRALTQLEVAAELDAAALGTASVYRAALACEAFRAEVFNGRRSPLIFGEPADWMARMVESLRLASGGQLDESRVLRDEALELAPARSGSLDATRFAWMADADSRLGPFLEAIVNGRYYWVPFERVSTMVIEPPTQLRDLIWIPAFLTLTNETQLPALLPVRYPGTETQSDEALVLARRTDWVEQPGGAFFGLGQRIFTTDQDEHALLETRTIQFDAEDGAR